MIRDEQERAIERMRTAEVYDLRFWWRQRSGARRADPELWLEAAKAIRTIVPRIAAIDSIRRERDLLRDFFECEPTTEGWTWSEAQLECMEAIEAFDARRKEQP